MTSKLTIRSKLAAALAVPLIALAALVAVQVRASVHDTDQARVQADIAMSATGPAGIITAIQNERNFEGVRAIGMEKAVTMPVKSIQEARKNTNTAIESFRGNLDSLDSKAEAAYAPALTAIQSGLAPLRKTADGIAAHASLDQAPQANVVFTNYTNLLGKLLDANEKVPLTIDNADVRTGVELLDSLSRQVELEARAIRAELVAGLLKDKASAVAAPMLVGQRQANENRVRNLAQGDYEKPVLGVLDNAQRVPYIQLTDSAGADPLKTDLTKTLAASPTSPKAQIGYAQTAVSKIVAEKASTLKDDATTKQRNYMLVAFGAVALAFFVLMLANRWITKPLSKLADEARVMAGQRLPNVVNSILETPMGEDVVPPEIEPIRVRGGAEVSGAVDALNMVQESAVGLAVEQVVLRRNIADSFVNLGRRNQNLLSRQLELITHLEQEEGDAEELEKLFRLDHLATRMRRNAESLLVLAGEEPARQWSAPVPIGDVLRAALGEVEQYSRVHLQPMDETTVIGRSVADVSHIVAELAENALSFSPPDSSVEMYGRHSDEGFEIAIVDAGIGMSEADLDRANIRLRGEESFNVAPSRYLGHYVVAQLAQRHDIRVELAASADGGVIAVIMLPFSVLEDGTDKSAEATPDVEEFSFADFTMPDTPTEAPAGSAIAALAAVTDGRDSASDDLDVPSFMNSTAFMVEGETEAHAPDASDAPAEAVDDVDDVEPVASIEVADFVEPVEPLEPFAFEPIAEPAVGETDADADADAAVFAQVVDDDEPSFASVPEFEPPADVESEPEPAPAPMPFAAAAAELLGPPPVGDAAPPQPFVDPVAPAFDMSEAPLADAPVDETPAPSVNKGAFAAMLQDAQASAPAESQPADGDALVEPDAPATEPVEAFVQRAPLADDDAPPAEEAAPAEVAFVGAPIQDDLLPQLPRRNRRSRNAASAPSVPDQLLRIAAAQDDEPATAEVVDESAEAMEPVTAGAPPLPKREMDAESVAPPPAAPTQPAMPEPVKPAPNYELFAAFRAATDQGRADAVRGSDGGGA